jgi:hypothetical protein
VLVFISMMFGTRPAEAAWVLVAYVASICVFFAGLFAALEAVRVPRPAAQMLCGLAAAAMGAIIFCSNLLLEGADSKQQVERVIWWVSNASPVSVVGTILADDPAHQRVMYNLSRLADYGVVRADVVSVILFFAISGLVLLALSLLSTILKKKPLQSPPTAS